jgi:hypothetical protein
MVRISKGAWTLFFALAPLLSVAPAHAADCALSIRPQDISVNPTAPFLDKSARVYATVQPLCQRDTEGEVVFYANDKLIGSKPISYRKNGLAEEVWVNWTPKDYGDNVLRVDTKGESGEVGDSASIKLFIDMDTDGDGIANSADPDDDNDGVPDKLDKYPLDPTRTKDTDGDGIDDLVDSDIDNDGLYNFEEKAIGTDPYKYDTDGDGVGDKQDAYPLDPKRWELPDAPKEVVTAPTGNGEVLGATFENAVVTDTLALADTSTPAAPEHGSPLDWLLGFGKWFLLAALFLLIGIFFFWQDKRRRKDEPEHKA